MLKEYTVDEKRRWDLAKKQLKRHPKWQKRKWVRWILTTLSIVAPIYGCYLQIVSPILDQEYLANTRIVLVMNIIQVGIFFGMIPWLITLPYIAVLRGTCFSESNYKLIETLCLTDEGIENIYHPLDATESNYAIELRIPFKNITKLIYNEYHERIQVFGQLKVTRYLNYEKNVVDNIENYEKNEGYSRRFYEYYENFGDFMKTVSEKSGVPIQHINCPEE